MTQDKALKILKAKQNVFLTGEPGAGKSHTINIFTEYLRDSGIGYAVTASTGIAATHINGITIHSWCGIGIKEEIEMSDIDLIMMKTHLVKQICSAQVLIIDEISILDARTLDNVDKVITYIRTGNWIGDGMLCEAFGGMQVIFVGDFYQLPPVKRGQQFCFHSKAWVKANVQTCYLTEQHRQNDRSFLDVLNRMREGTVTEEDKALLLSKTGKTKPETKLFTHNKDVDHINSIELGKIKEKSEVYEMTSEGNEYLVSVIKKSCLSPETLTLKLGALVMFTRNNFEKGYVNGTLGKVVGFDEYSNNPIVKLKDGMEITAERAKWSIDKSGREEASVMQIPLRLAWAFSVHKSQGMSLDSAFVELSDAFEFGQGYVAISRVCSLEGLWLEGANEKAFLMHPDVVEQDKVFRASSSLIEIRY